MNSATYRQRFSGQSIELYQWIGQFGTTELDRYSDDFLKVYQIGQSAGQHERWHFLTTTIPTGFRPQRRDIRYFGFGKDVPLDVVEYCERHDLWTALFLSLRLVQAHFVTVWDETLLLRTDPESGDSWVAVGFRTSCRPEDLIKAHLSYAESWVDAINWPKRDRIRLSYSIV